mgnify:CR=1 FL=1
MNTLFPFCSIFHPLRATADSVADTCSSKVASFCVILYANCAPSTGSPITNNFNSKMHNIVIPKVATPTPIFFFTVCSSSNSDLFLDFVFKLYHKTCEQFYRNFGLYEKSPNSFLPGRSEAFAGHLEYPQSSCGAVQQRHIQYQKRPVAKANFATGPYYLCAFSHIFVNCFRRI